MKKCYICSVKTKIERDMAKKKNTEDETMFAEQMKALYDEMMNTLLERAGIKKKDIYEVALKTWASKNLDLLTAAELRKYQKVIR